MFHRTGKGVVASVALLAGLLCTASLSSLAAPSEEYRTYLPAVVRNHAPVGWQTIVAEDFETVFPGPWKIFDNLDGYGEYYWYTHRCRAWRGNHSAWAVGFLPGPLDCGDNYPDHVQSWMAYGPFSLVGATDAELRFRYWLNTEPLYDEFKSLASKDGIHFHGLSATGNSGGWQAGVLDLADVPELGDLRGEPQVWIAFVFTSDASTNLPEGAYVDEVLLRKKVSPATMASAVESSLTRGEVSQGDLLIVPTEATLQR